MTKLDTLVDILKDAPDEVFIQPHDEVAVIDHHEFCGDKGYRFMDIRPEAGSCSAIIADWFFENNIEPPRHVATALLYGIFMDTDNLTRGVSDIDINMFYKLYIRSSCQRVKANDMVKYIVEGFGVGGGHDNMAGGFISKEKLSESRVLDTFIKHRAISYFEMRR